MHVKCSSFRFCRGMFNGDSAESLAMINSRPPYSCSLVRATSDKQYSVNYTIIAHTVFTSAQTTAGEAKEYLMALPMHHTEAKATEIAETARKVFHQ